MIRVNEIISSCKDNDRITRIGIIDHGDLLTIPARSDLLHNYRMRVVKSWKLHEGVENHLILFLELKGGSEQ